MKTFIIVLFMVVLMLESRCNNKSTSNENKSDGKVVNKASLKIGDKEVFSLKSFQNATVTKYPNQILFSLVDDEGQNVTITFAGKDISKRKPNELTFNQPGLFHGYSESQDVFFVAFGKLVEDREPGQLKYERHWPQHVMEGKLKVVSWTDSSFEFTFEGKLGNDDEVNTPNNWQPFSGSISASNYQLFEM